MGDGSSLGMIIFSGAAGAIGGAILGAAVSSVLNDIRAGRQFRSLLILIAWEMVKAYERCVIYDEQAKSGAMSYSSMFSFSDPSTLARFASVALDSEAEAIKASINLKYHFSQVARHVEKASEFALESSRLNDLVAAARQMGNGEDARKHEEEAQKNMLAAQRMRGTALAFFVSPYSEIERDLEVLVSGAERIRGDKVSQELRKAFDELRSKYRQNNPATFK